VPEPQDRHGDPPAGADDERTEPGADPQAATEADRTAEDVAAGDEADAAAGDEAGAADADEAGAADGALAGPPPLPRIARSTGGQLLAAAMFGLRDALEDRPREEVAIVVEAPGQPHRPDDFDLELDFEHPERSRVVLRRPVADDLDAPGPS
jgi:hypothetical protein